LTIPLEIFIYFVVEHFYKHRKCSCIQWEHKMLPSCQICPF